MSLTARDILHTIEATDTLDEAALNPFEKYDIPSEKMGSTLVSYKREWAEHNIGKLAKAGFGA